MRIKTLASLAIATAALVACSGESTTTPPSKAQQCTSGLSNDCLMGTWSIKGPTIERTVETDVIHIIDPSHDLTASPAKLKFYVDDKNINKFEFTNSPLSKDACINSETGKIYGDWSIVGTSLTLIANKGSVTCMDPTNNPITLTPVIEVNGSTVTMTFPKIFFMEPEMKGSDAVEKVSATEVYTFETAN